MSLQQKIRHAYLNPRVQVAVALLIVGNFVTQIFEKQLDPFNEKNPFFWYILETFWNSVFIIELLFNMAGSFYFTQWKGHFLRSGWNLFDLAVVLMSIPFILRVNIDALQGMVILRTVRAVRVFRLFHRIPSLNKIIISVIRAIPGILNSGVIMVVVMCIYAIVGVELFGTYGADGTYVVAITNEVVELKTGRGMTYGQEYWGTFGRSLYTLLQVLTGESWSEAIARPTVYGKDTEWRSLIFYTSFIFICSIVLINVAMAVLLDKMVSTVEGASASEGDSKKAENPPASSSPLTSPKEDQIETVLREMKVEKDVAAKRERALLGAIAELSAKVDALSAELPVETLASLASLPAKVEALTPMAAQLEALSPLPAKVDALAKSVAGGASSPTAHRKKHRSHKQLPPTNNGGAKPTTPGSGVEKILEDAYDQYDQSPEDRMQDCVREASTAPPGRTTSKMVRAASGLQA